MAPIEDLKGAAEQQLGLPCSNALAKALQTHGQFPYYVGSSNFAQPFPAPAA
jgi:hypothetical protein